jgi:thiamine pyrophosphate-dependent acetolactate synthase large subunit-like protein
VHFHEAFAMDASDQGISTIFGLVGDGNLFLMDSFQRQPGARYVSVANEASAVAAAAGYSQVTGELGVASVTHGPALTNTITPLIEAVKGGVPLLLIAGDTAVADVENFQNIPQREIVQAAGAGFVQVRAPATVGADLAFAVQRARLERRPFVLNVPADYQWAEVEHIRAPRRPAGRQAVAPDEAALDGAVGIIAAARRPLVLAGRGAIDPRSREALIGLAARLNAPLATTLKAKGLFWDQPANLGLFGTLSHELALETILHADCVIAFGAGLNDWTTADGSLLKDKAVVQVDIDATRIGRYAIPDAAVVGDAGITAQAVVSWLDSAETPQTAFASEKLLARLGGYGSQQAEPADPDEPISIQEALRVLDQSIPPDRTVIYDSGRFIFTAFAALPVRDPRGFVHTANYAAIGLAVPTGIGAAVGEPGRPTVVVTGDGGFVLGGLTEFSTAVRHGLDLLIVVLNDGAFGAEHIQMTSRSLEPAITTFDWPDLGPVAEVLGGFGATVRTPGELRRALDDAAGRRPALIDVKLDPYQVPWPGGHR